MSISPYYETDELKEQVHAGGHRDAIGGLWEELGNLQMMFLKEHGLQPTHSLLDIGCGSLRLGVQAVDYLEAGNYFGTDISQELLDAGYEKELDSELQLKLPKENLAANGDFDFSFLKQKIDFAVAQSLFTHLPMNHIRRCLRQLQAHMHSGGALYATFCICPDHHPINEPLEHPCESEAGRDNTVSHDYCDPYHYTLSDLEYCAKETPWKVQLIGDWGHPRNLQMVAFILE